MSRIPTIKFNNGYTIPVLGLGTWKAQAGKVIEAVKVAIDLGYRHIDCAYFYLNEHEIGAALAHKLSDKAVGREDLFITSKLWNTFHRPQDVEPAFKRTLRDLRLKYLDLYLIHWPMAYRPGKSLMPRNEKREIAHAQTDFVDTWKAMEELVKKRLTRSIGVANFNKRQLERILDNCGIAPVTNQVECHPYLNQKDLMEFCKCKEITITCYSPLGSPDRPWAKPNEPVLLKDNILVEIACKHKRTPAQIALRYQVQRGNIVIPKSVSKARLQENTCIFDFRLEHEDMKKLDCLHTGTRYVLLKPDFRHPEHPFARDAF